MSRDSITNDINQAVPHLLELARSLAWNPIAEDCLFLLTEGPFLPITAGQTRQTQPHEAPHPVPLHVLEPALRQRYDQLHDINLFIYWATRERTIIEIRCYLRTYLPEAYRLQVRSNPPMLHCKVAIPPWVALAQPPEKFDINWERKRGWTRWKMFQLRFRHWFRQG